MERQFSRTSSLSHIGDKIFSNLGCQKPLSVDDNSEAHCHL
jgi:hypothetical protein